MFTVKSAAIVAVSFLIAASVAPLADATARSKALSVDVAQRLETLSASGSGLINVGTSDGTIGGRKVQGALRAVITARPPKFTAVGTLFYATGSLRYTLTGTTTAAPNGSVVIHATGAFTGGAGAYAGAHGSFTGSGVKPANAPETFTLKGKVSLR